MVYTCSMAGKQRKDARAVARRVVETLDLLPFSEEAAAAVIPAFNAMHGSVRRATLSMLRNAHNLDWYQVLATFDTVGKSERR